MQTAILNTESKSDFKLLIELAKKIGIQAKIMTNSEIDELGLINAIKKGRTKTYVNNDAFLKKLRK